MGSKVQEYLGNVFIDKNGNSIYPVAFSFLGQISGLVVSDTVQYLLDKIPILAKKQKQKQERDKLNREIALELENMFLEKTWYDNQKEYVQQRYKSFKKENPKVTAAASIVVCLGMTNGLIKLSETKTVGNMANFLGRDIIGGIPLVGGIYSNYVWDGLIKRLFTTDSIKAYVNQQYVYPYLKTQISEILKLEKWWKNKLKKQVGLTKEDENKTMFQLLKTKKMGKFAAWTFVYIFDLPRRLLEDKMAMGLAECAIGTEQNVCSNIADIYTKMQENKTWDDAVKYMMRPVGKGGNSLFQNLNWLLSSEDDYTKLALESKMSVLLMKTEKNTYENLHTQLQDDFKKIVDQLFADNPGSSNIDDPSSLKKKILDRAFPGSSPDDKITGNRATELVDKPFEQKIREHYLNPDKNILEKLKNVANDGKKIMPWEQILEDNPEIKRYRY